MSVTLHHNQIELALHRLAEGTSDCQPLLFLHGLGEETGDTVPLPWGEWPGPVWGLDFTGHGESTVPSGGGYTCEILASDVDIALAHIGPATVVGRGLGAYVGLMTAAGRPELVRGLVLADGPGLAGGSDGPGSATWFAPAGADGSVPDPFALFELSTDIRPADYATGFLRLLLDHSDLANPVTVTAKVRPPWLEAVANEPGVLCEAIAVARDRYASGPQVNS